MSEEGPVRLVLTQEQRELVHRMSGKHVEAIELHPGENGAEHGMLRLLWRLSAASGIPRQVWQPAEATESSATE